MDYVVPEPAAGMLTSGAIRAVHACWDEAVIHAIQPHLKANHAITEAYWEEVFEKIAAVQHDRTRC